MKPERHHRTPRRRLEPPAGRLTLTPAAPPRRRSGPARAAALLAVLALVAAGCRQAMHDQPRYRTLSASSFFPDGKSARPLVPGTVARGHLNADRPFFTGMTSDSTYAATLPMPLGLEVLRRGQQRYAIHCTPCHDDLGTGRGMVVQRGYRQPPSYHIDRLRNVPVGYFVDVMTKGFGVMPSYAGQVAPEDRWAIAAYIRALQLSQHADAALLSDADRQRLQAVPRGSSSQPDSSFEQPARGIQPPALRPQSPQLPPRTPGARQPAEER